MFDQTFVDTHAQTRRPWTVAVSLAFQTTLAAIALVAPLFRVAALQRPESVSVWLPPLAEQRAEPREAKPAPRAIAAARAVFRLEQLPVPASVPRSIRVANDAPDVGNPLPGAQTGIPGLALLPGTVIEPPAQSPPAAVSPPKRPPAPLRVSNGVQSAKLLFAPKPAYPPIARATRTMGTVRIQAIIGRDGAIRDLRVMGGPALLIQAAIEAVERWRYQPTLLNTEPVEVITEIDVNFTIN